MLFIIILPDLKAMKNKLFLCSLLLTWPFMSSASSQTFYSLKEAQTFYSDKKNDYYLQITVKKNEPIDYSKIHYPIAFHPKTNQTMMIIGPIPRADEVRAISKQLQPHRPLRKKAAITKPTVQLSPIHTPKKTNHWYLGSGVGAQQLNMDNPILVSNISTPNRYWTQTNAELVVSGELGHEWSIENKWISALDIGFYYNHLFPTDIGDRISVGNTKTRNYIYNWKLSSDVFLALGRVNLLKFEKFIPFVEGGIGSSLNHSTQYSEAPLPHIVQRENPLFKNYTNHVFAYAIGAGIGWTFDPHFNLSIAYQFQNLGHVNSGNAQNPQWNGGLLNNTTYQTNLAELRLNYLF